MFIKFAITVVCVTYWVEGRAILEYLAALLGVLAPGTGRPGRLLPPDQPHHVLERLVHVARRVLGAGLDVGHAELLSHVPAFPLAHHALLGQIHLVGDQEGRKGALLLLDPADEVLKLGHVVVGRAVRHRVHDQEAVPGAHVLLPHGRELFLAGRVQYVQDAPLEKKVCFSFA